MVRVAPVLLLSVLAGCGSGSKDDLNARRWGSVVTEFTDHSRLARFDLPGSTLHSSVDPTGRNDDFNHPLRLSEEPGWVVLADLKGPGVLTRFWMTGMKSGDHPIRLTFDDEKTPRIDGRLGDLCGGVAPFLKPFGYYQQYCWKSFLPLTYNKRLLIEAATSEPGKSPAEIKMYFQFNTCSLEAGGPVQSYPRKLSAEDIAVVERAGVESRKWAMAPELSLPLGHAADRVLAADESATLLQITGSDTLSELRVTCEPVGESVTALQRRNVLRDVLMRIYWDDHAHPSVDVPVGDFFGSMWGRRRLSTAYFGMTGQTFYSRFPMPFSRNARIEFVNQGATPVRLKVEAALNGDSWDGSSGYFHAAWNSSTPASVGSPHSIVSLEGRGKYVGCILNVASADKSWWILEGDEQMRVDGSLNPSWLGTGLEDYFNGGWYYQNPFIQSTYGLIFKAPSRTVQYRVHLADAVQFNRSFGMWFERGPGNASKGWMESVAFYYLNTPGAAAGEVGSKESRPIPPDPLQEGTIMTELLNRERFGDYLGAREQIAEFLETFPKYGGRSLLELRDIGYVEKLRGYEVAGPLYEAFIATHTDDGHAVAQARLLKKFFENPEISLLGVYCNARTSVYIDGAQMGPTYLDKQVSRLRVDPISLSAGKHLMVLDAEWVQGYSFVYAAIRTHQGIVSTDLNWRYMNAPTGDWQNRKFDDSGWEAVAALVKGPPEHPIIFVAPNGFVGMQSTGGGLRAGDWDRLRGRAVFRSILTIPSP